MRWTALLACLASAAVSAYGWWFYFSVNPTRDAGLPIGLAGAMLAAVALFLAIISSRRSD
jgi:hypothetical protein